jgi:hypothetical protein
MRRLLPLGAFLALSVTGCSNSVTAPDELTPTSTTASACAGNSGNCGNNSHNHNTSNNSNNPPATAP